MDKKFRTKGGRKLNFYTKRPRVKCPGCDSLLLHNTFQFHRKLFLKPNGIWIPHRSPGTECSNVEKIEKENSGEKDILNQNFMDFLLNQERTEQRDNFIDNDKDGKAYGGLEEKEKGIGDDLIETKEFFDVCCDFFRDTSLRVLDDFLFKNCQVCLKVHPHFCLGKSGDYDFCPNCASSGHVLRDCKTIKISEFHLIRKTQIKPPPVLLEVEKPYELKPKCGFFNKSDLNSIVHYITKSSNQSFFNNLSLKNEDNEDNKDDDNNKETKNYLPKKNKNFYLNRFGMPLVSAKDCRLEEISENLESESDRGDNIVHMVKRDGQYPLERRNYLERRENDFKVRKRNGALEFESGRIENFEKSKREIEQNRKGSEFKRDFEDLNFKEKKNRKRIKNVFISEKESY